MFLVKGPGHNSMVFAPDSKSEYIVYHAWGKDARQMCLDKIVWTTEGPRCEGPTWKPQMMKL